MLNLFSADNLRSVLAAKRNCYFPDESKDIMNLHKNYSQANCLLECSLKYAQKSQCNGSEVCTPWYFPLRGNGHKICDPWEAKQLLIYIANKVKHIYMLICYLFRYQLFLTLFDIFLSYH